MYARNLPAGGAPITARHSGAELMYHSGNVIDVAVAVVMTQWYQATRRALARRRRRSATAGPDHPMAVTSPRRVNAHARPYR